MGLQIGIATQNKEVLNKVLETLTSVYKENADTIDPISVIHLKTPGLITDFVKFEFPDFLILCIEEKTSDTIEILKKINEDPWLHSTGIIIIYMDGLDSSMLQFENLSVLSYLSIHELSYQLPKIMKIVMTNRLSFMNIGLVENLITHKSGEFVLENDPSVVNSYVNILTASLLNEKEITPVTENAIKITLMEMLMNAIEHGNCGISFEEKSAYLEKGGNINELIKQKNMIPGNENKRIYLSYTYTDDEVSFNIRDCGKGFDYKNMNYDPESEEDLSRLHGRGIYMSQYFASSIIYKDPGNEVTVTFKKDKDQSKKPLGFASLHAKQYQPGDIVFKQNDRTNSLYYIQKGVYYVEVNGRKVAELTASDMFLGEMSFLLNNKRVATIKAKTEGLLIEIPKSVFINIIKKYPNYGLFLSKLLAVRLEKMNEMKTS